MSNRTFVIGVGMTKFEKPGSRGTGTTPTWRAEAGTKALADAGIAYDEVEQAFVGYCYGDSTSGPAGRLRARPDRHPGRQRQQQLLHRLDRAVPRAPGRRRAASPTACSRSASRRWRTARSAMKFTDRTSPMDKHLEDMMHALRARSRRRRAPQMFGNAGREHMERYGSTAETTSPGSARRTTSHSVNNPYAQFQDEYTLEEILDAPMIHDAADQAAVLARPPTAAARAIVASERFVDEHGLWDRAVEIAGQAMATDIRVDLRRQRHRSARRLRHVAEAGAQAYEESRPRPRGRRRHRAARLLQRQRADHLRGARAVRAEGKGRRARRRRGDDLRRRRGSSTRPAA